MARRKRRRKKSEDEHTFLRIEVKKYEVRVETSLNLNLRGVRPLFARDDDLVYTFFSSLEITGVSTYPEERAGHCYEITVYGHETHSGDFALTLRDVQARDEHSAPLYRSYRGEEIPVYNCPPGIATIDRQHGATTWQAWVFVARRLASDMLVLLGQRRPLYLAIHERKTERQRWIVSLTLQATDPAED
jgi:hypothetical protein